MRCRWDPSPHPPFPALVAQGRGRVYLIALPRVAAATQPYPGLFSFCPYGAAGQSLLTGVLPKYKQERNGDRGGPTPVMNSQIMAISHVAATGRGTDTVALRHLGYTPLRRLLRGYKVPRFAYLHRSVTGLKQNGESVMTRRERMKGGI